MNRLDKGILDKGEYLKVDIDFKSADISLEIFCLLGYQQPGG